MAKQERRSREFWVHLVAQFESSPSMSQRDFCTRHGVSYGTFRNWLSKQRRARAMERSSRSVVSSSFVEIERGPSPSHAPATPAIMDCGRFRVCFEELPSPAWLAELMARTQGGLGC
ncbi:MAG: IS66 family insertion sequence element accessory protein TnpA [Bradymonadaceae bacterium]